MLGRTRCGLRDAGCEIDVSFPCGGHNVALYLASRDTKRTTYFLTTTQQGEAAFKAKVHRLPTSPDFGERWASMWLDLVRYADSKGLGQDGRGLHLQRFRYTSAETRPAVNPVFDHPAAYCPHQTLISCSTKSIGNSSAAEFTSEASEVSKSRCAA